ncbi:triadin, putative [Entamoeba dispar SAW760]|uniref:Triadin, putative n=1 Tax=Entamoeba dispar (strain ATCC PRA-260 / SAW760) TaxID=370354 RepID=B0EG33_ENTDS|nr:triadin, putative [Entamoeba dispar SAW760]EDR26527.1 triadin, putative [Entamoeba dispar SAW760]|eukprot:EDR26527.1 triadin, putative [Entamoeba dispar SAW760]
MQVLHPHNFDFDTLIDQLRPELPQSNLIDLNNLISIDTHFPLVFSSVLTKRLNLHIQKCPSCIDDLNTLKCLRSTKTINLRGKYNTWLQQINKDHNLNLKEESGESGEILVESQSDGTIPKEEQILPTISQNKEINIKVNKSTTPSIIENKEINTKEEEDNNNTKEEDKKEINTKEEEDNNNKEEEEEDKKEELIRNIQNYYGEESKIKNYIRANEIEKGRKKVELGKEIEEEIALIIGGISDDVKQIEIISREIIEICKKEKEKREGIIMKIIENMIRNEVVVTTNPNRIHVYGEIIGNICFQWKEYREKIIIKLRSITPIFNSIYPKTKNKEEYEMIMKYKNKETDEKYFNRIRHTFKILTGILMSEAGDQTILLDIVMNGIYMQYDNKEICLGTVGDLIGSMVEIMLDESGDQLKNTPHMSHIIQTIKEYLPIAQSHWDGKGPQADYVMRKIKVQLTRYEKNLPFNKKVLDYQNELITYKKQMGLETRVWQNTTKINLVESNDTLFKQESIKQESIKEDNNKEDIKEENTKEENSKIINKEDNKEEKIKDNTKKYDNKEENKDNVKKEESVKEEKIEDNNKEESNKEENKEIENTKENKEDDEKDKEKQIKEQEEEKKKELEDDPEAEADIYFKPIIELKEIEQEKMEEEILFKERGICVRYDSENEEFKERGRGEVEILKHPNTQLSRVILIRDQIFKLACNHYILPYIKIKEFPNNQRAVMYSVYEDYAQDEPKNIITFGICFNKEEIKEKFIKIFKELQEETQNIINKKEEKKEEERKEEIEHKQKEEIKKEEIKEERIKKEEIKEEEIKKEEIKEEEIKKENIEEKGESEERNRKIFNYQEFDIFGGKNPYDNMTTQKQENKRKKGSDIIKEEENEHIKEKKSEEEKETQEEKNKENREFKAFDFSNILNKETDKNTLMINTQTETTHKKIEETNIINGLENQEKSNTLNIQEYDNTQPQNNTEQKIKEPSEIYTSNHEQLTPFNQNENQEIIKEEEKKKELEDDPEAEADIYFKPIIELKEIEQEKMEEDILFKERGICVRYDSENEEFKERGRGEVEILKHPNTQLSRVILIRDQIFKLACNHYILPYIKIKEFPNNQRAVMYSVYEDYAQDEPKNTITFGICFNKEEIKEKFIKIFKELQEETQNIINKK